MPTVDWYPSYCVLTNCVAISSDIAFEWYPPRTLEYIELTLTIGSEETTMSMANTEEPSVATYSPADFNEILPLL